LLFFRNGFKKIASGRPPKKIACAHALSLAEFKITNSCFSLTKNLISRLVPREITIPYPFDDVFWVLYRLKG
jgi:hypothetical protein